MKKFLTALIASIIAVVMVLFVACDTGSTSNIYSGNYVETDAEGLYAVTSSIEDSELVPTEDENVGISIKFSSENTEEIYTNYIDKLFPQNSYTSKSSNITKSSINGKLISTLNEDLDTAVYANLSSSLISSVSNTVNDVDLGTDSNQNDTNIYILENDVFLDSLTKITEDNETSSISQKTKTSYEAFLVMMSEMISQIMGEQDGPALDMAPPTSEDATPEEIKESINNLIENAGMRFSIDTSKGTKIKMDVADKDLFLDYISTTTDESLDLTIDLNKMEAYIVFDSENKFTAIKFDLSVKGSANVTAEDSSFSGNSSIQTSASISMEIKFYNGDVSIPEINPDEYSPIE